VIYAECHNAKCRHAECHHDECRYAECHYAECCNFIVILSDIILSGASFIVMLSVIMLFFSFLLLC
jgi:hypothetical protein